MDWSKAKTILIIALLFTNLILLWNYDFREESKASDADKEALLKVLEAQDIYLDVELPGTHADMPILSIRYLQTDEELVKQKLETAKRVEPDSLDEIYVSAAEGFIGELGYNSDTMAFSEVRDGENLPFEIPKGFTASEALENPNAVCRQVVFRNIFEDVPVEESYMICTYVDGKLADFSRYWLEPVGTGKKKVHTISAASAMVSFMGEQSENERVVVEDIRLVYWLDDAAFDVESAVSDMAFPAWKITYNGGKTTHIEATQM
ncbi:MAG: two-component system regulatory protein YycI [Clostridia bacterium]|nr:two-component system regulatory protein YycI [Clostridia bacterium]